MKKTPHSYRGLEELECLETGFSNWVEYKTDKILNLIEGKNVLDIGCGIGTFTEKIANAGYKVTAIDYAAKPKKTKNYKFVRADILNLGKVPKGPFDSVIALDVLEHVEHDQKAIANIYKLLKPGGTIVLTVPAFPQLYAPLDAKIGHIRRYTQTEIIQKIRKAGFKTKKRFYWNFAGLFGWIIFCKILGKSTTSAKNPFSNAVLDVSLSIEKRINPPIGLTLFVKATKPKKAEKK